MPLFSIVVHGECPPAATAIGPKARGFYVARLVQAATQERAREMARSVVSADPKTHAIGVQFGSMPRLTIDSVAQVPWWRRFARQPGFVVYDESQDAPLDARVV